MPKRQTSSRISTLAAKLLKRTDGARLDMTVTYTETDHRLRDICTVAELRSICASAISQDETKGNAKPKKRAKRKPRKA